MGDVVQFPKGSSTTQMITTNSAQPKPSFPQKAPKPGGWTPRVITNPNPVPKPGFWSRVGNLGKGLLRGLSRALPVIWAAQQFTSGPPIIPNYRKWPPEAQTPEGVEWFEDTFGSHLTPEQREDWEKYKKEIKVAPDPNKDPMDDLERRKIPVKPQEQEDCPEEDKSIKAQKDSSPKASGGLFGKDNKWPTKKDKEKKKDDLSEQMEKLAKEGLAHQNHYQNPPSNAPPKKTMDKLKEKHPNENLQVVDIDSLTGGNKIISDKTFDGPFDWDNFNDPIRVKKDSNGNLEVQEGMTRWNEAKKYGVKKVPVIIEN